MPEVKKIVIGDGMKKKSKSQTSPSKPQEEEEPLNKIEEEKSELVDNTPDSNMASLGISVSKIDEQDTSFLEVTENSEV